MKYLKYFKTSNQFDDFKLDDTNTPNVSLIEELYSVKYTKFIPRDYTKEYFTFVARQNCTMNFDLLFEDVNPENNISCGSISYSLNNGETWSEEYGEIELNLNAGEKVLLKGHMNVFDGGYDQPKDLEGGWIVSTGYFDVVGNIMSLFYGDDFENKSLSGKEISLAAFFKGNTYLVNAKNLILPSEISNCDGGFLGMFSGCTSLITAPKLPATTLSYQCYQEMFNGCTSLTTAPELPATTLEGFCYQEMFNGCTSLTTAPELPAYELNYNCYYGMFSGCTSLTTAPELLAPTIESESYMHMFDGCTSLNYIKCLAENNVSYDNTGFWVRDVAASGTFVRDINTEWETGNNGIPSGWTVITEGTPESSYGSDDYGNNDYNGYQ